MSSSFISFRYYAPVGFSENWRNTRIILYCQNAVSYHNSGDERKCKVLELVQQFGTVDYKNNQNPVCEFPEDSCDKILFPNISSHSLITHCYNYCDECPMNNYIKYNCPDCKTDQKCFVCARALEQTR